MLHDPVRLPWVHLAMALSHRKTTTILLHSAATILPTSLAEAMAHPRVLVALALVPDLGLMDLRPQATLVLLAVLAFHKALAIIHSRNILKLPSVLQGCVPTYHLRLNTHLHIRSKLPPLPPLLHLQRPA